MTTMHPLVQSTVFALHTAFDGQHDCYYFDTCWKGKDTFTVDDFTEVTVDGRVNLHEMARSILKHLVGDRLAYQAECGGLLILGPEGFEFEGDEEALFRLWRP